MDYAVTKNKYSTLKIKPVSYKTVKKNPKLYQFFKIFKC